MTIIEPVEKHMEVIVDDSQLSLAIGKKVQNVRLAAKLLGWKIDIKSEEEKRQEVETAMAALVVPGAPVSVLIDYGLEENIAEKLLEAGVSTVEKLGNMTPEQLEEIPGIGENLVEKIQVAVNNYYGQFETADNGAAQQVEAAEAVEQGEMAVETIQPETPDVHAEPEPDLEVSPEDRAVLEEIAGGSATSEAAVPETPETEQKAQPSGGESDTIIDSRSGAKDRGSEKPPEEGQEG